MQRYIVGHSAYRGRNAQACHEKYSQALRDLLSRGIRMKDAHKALQSARNGSHATCTYYSKSHSGKWVAIDTVECIILDIK